MGRQRQIQALCDDCACSIYNTRAPSLEYARRVAKLLFMTAAHESGGFRWRRQLGLGRFDNRGAFGLWQCERASIEDSIRFVRSAKRRALYHHCVDWLDAYDHDFPDLSLSEHDLNAITTVMQDNRGDPLACLMARLHYLKFPGAVPPNTAGMAAYAKQYYNTHLGKAVAADYLIAFEKYWPGDEKE